MKIFTIALTILFIGFVGLLIWQKISYRKSFIQMQLWDVYSVEKTFFLGPSRITLLGMMHVADHSFYESLKADFKEYKGLALCEGVSDQTLRMKSVGDFSYKEIASLFGLEAQAPEIFPRQQRADLDIADFKDSTVVVLEKFTKVIQVFNARNLITMAESDQDSLHKLGEAVSEQEMASIDPEILGKRNDHLFSVLEETLRHEDEVLIPWGAAHLPDIEKRIKALGYKEQSSKRRLLVSIPHVIGSFATNMNEEAEKIETERKLKEAQ